MSLMNTTDSSGPTTLQPCTTPLIKLVILDQLLFAAFYNAKESLFNTSVHLKCRKIATYFALLQCSGSRQHSFETEQQSGETEFFTAFRVSVH